MLMFLCQSFNRFVVYATFYANQNFIEQNLCENRDKPWLHCDGHCQLNKKLADDNKQDSQTPAQRAAGEMSMFFIHPVALYTEIFHTEILTPLNGHYTSLALQIYTGSTFHPPAIA